MDHEIQFPLNLKLSDAIYCSYCFETVVLDGFPERTNGKWMHISEWRQKQTQRMPENYEQLQIWLANSYNKGVVEGVVHEQQKTRQLKKVIDEIINVVNNQKLLTKSSDDHDPSIEVGIIRNILSQPGDSNAT